MVGNGVTDKAFDGNALIPFVHRMGLISDDLHEEVVKACQGNYYDPATEACETSLAKVDRVLDGLNIYDILEPCYHDSEIRQPTADKFRLPSSFRELGETERPLGVRKRMFGRAWPFRAPVNVPCTGDEVATLWLNDEAVRKAIHADLISIAGSWDLCTDRISFYHDAGSMIKFYRNLTSRGYRALIFSEDHDMCVPFTGSQDGQGLLDIRSLMNGGLGSLTAKLQGLFDHMPITSLF